MLIKQYRTETGVLTGIFSAETKEMAFLDETEVLIGLSTERKRGLSSSFCNKKLK